MKKTLIIIYLLFSYIILYAADPVIVNGESDTNDSNSLLPAEKYRMKRIYQIGGYYIDASPGLSFIKNKNLSPDIWNINGDFGYKFNVGYFQSLNQWAWVKLGVGFSSYSAHISGSGVFTSPEFKDIDNDAYIESLTVSNADYSINPMYLTIPLSIEFGNANISKIGYYINFGIEYSYLIHENNKAIGTYSAKGIYPQWGVELENIPELGFYSERNVGTDWNMQKSNISLKGGAGITIPLSGVVIFKLGLTGYLGLKDISNKEIKKDDSSPISQQAYEFRSKYINSPLATSKGSKSFYTGIEFGFYISKRVK